MTTGAGFSRYHAALQELEHKSRLRTLAPRAGLDFTSNDYLGLASADRLRDAVAAALEHGTPVGAGGSRLLRGNAPEHEALEATAAAFFHVERALYFGSGYIANYAIFSTLPQRGDLVVLDALAHASTHEGTRAGRAEVRWARHNEPDAFDEEIRRYRAGGRTGRVWIAVESLYSMDGDFAPLAAFAELADRHDAILVVDEAHATGVYGPEGRGLAAPWEGRENVLVLHTCSKALGGAGALVTGPAVLLSFLINRCRPFIYATAPSPLMAVAAEAALQILIEEPDRRQRLGELVRVAGDTARACGITVRRGSQIMPYIVGEDGRALALAKALSARGFDVRAVRPPTVPEGTARLRISLTLNVDEAAVRALFGALVEELNACAG
jgi:8-amino-7-oxononanoate synthase